MLRVARLYRAPIKSCALEPVDEFIVGEDGIERDRCLLVLNEEGMFVSQRAARAKGVCEILAISQVCPSFKDDRLVLTAPEMETIDVPYSGSVGETLEARVWSFRGPVVEVSREASEWFTRYLGHDRPGTYRLVRTAPEWNRRAKSGPMGLGMADSDPFLILSMMSVYDLNRRLAARGLRPVTEENFRATIVLDNDGCGSDYGPYVEDQLKEIGLGAVNMLGGKLCERCPCIMVNPETGLRDQGAEPYKTLGMYRVSPHAKDDERPKPVLGRNFAHYSTGTIGVGCVVNIQQWDDLEAIAPNA